MSVKDRLKSIRPEPASSPARQQQWLRVLLACALGAAAGLLAKVADGKPVIGDIGTELGAWVLVATLLAAWSCSPRAAALHLFAFFAAMLAAYYTYSMHLFGFFPKYYFMGWSAFALLSPLAAYALWYARGNGWIAALCASLPVALLLSEGYAFFYTLSVPRGFALFSALLLFLVLPAKKAQWLRMIPLIAILFLLITQLGVKSLLFSQL